MATQALVDGVEHQDTRAPVALLVGQEQAVSLVTRVHQALQDTRAPVALLVGQVLQELVDGQEQAVSVDGVELLVSVATQA